MKSEVVTVYLEAIKNGSTTRVPTFPKDICAIFGGRLMDRAIIIAKESVYSLNNDTWKTVQIKENDTQNNRVYAVGCSLDENTMLVLGGYLKAEVQLMEFTKPSLGKELNGSII